MTLGEEHSDLHRRALELVRAGYEAIAAMKGSNLDVINRVRPPSLRFSSEAELLREWTHAAGACSTLAVRLHLITPDEAAEIIRAYERDHPEMNDPEVEAWGREDPDL